MIDPPTASPVAAETSPAASRISDSGSSSRRAIARTGPVSVSALSLFGP